jgi:hypothetical protein
MQLSLTGLVIHALAVWQAVEIWRHGQIFAGRRAELELSDGTWAELLLCGFCLSPWVAWLFIAVGWMPQAGWPALPPHEEWVTLKAFWACLLTVLVFWYKSLLVLAALFVHGLAVARLANLGNDVFHHYCRTPNRLSKSAFEENDDRETNHPDAAGEAAGAQDV